ncbi:MAG: hypothetical protein SPI14_06065 [Arcanobacterium sp.]|nr:hypothetical protein [Arcanobacterium sp.]
MTVSPPIAVDAYRSGDSGATITVSLPTTASSLSGVEIARALDHGSYQTVVVLPVASATFTDTGLVDGHIYEYRARTLDRGGEGSVWVEAGRVVYTRPRPPSDVQARRAGRNIILTWTTDSPYGVPVIREQGSTVAKLPAGTVTYEVIGADLSVEHTYTVELTTPDGVLASGEITANTIPKAGTPQPPVSLQTGEMFHPVGERVTATWVFVAPDDASQSAFEIQTSPDGEQWASLTRQTSNVEAYTFSAWTSPQTVYWRVRVWGTDPGLPSSWSEPGRIDVVQRPSIHITYPSEGLTVAKSFTDIVIDTDADQPYMWELTYRHDGRDIRREGNAAANPVPVTIADLTNATTYEVAARVFDRVWSQPVTRRFTTQFVQPPAPIVTVTNQEMLGLLVPANQITWSVPPPQVGQVPGESVTVVQVMPDGTTTRIGLDLPTNSTLVDKFAHGTKPTTYMVTVMGTNGFTSTTTVTVPVKTPLRYILLMSPSGTILPVKWNPEVKHTAGTQHYGTHYMLGRTYPVLFSGTQRAHTISVAGVLLSGEFASDDPLTGATSTHVWGLWDAMQNDVAAKRTPLFYRDPTGIACWVAVQQISFDRIAANDTWKVSYTAVEVDGGAAKKPTVGAW